LVIFTGGEPLLYQNGISKVLYYLPKKYKIEIETNGTVWPFPISMRHKIQYNVSPKLESSGNSKFARYKPEILKEFNRLEAIFKFVIQNEEDWKEMEEIVKEIKIPPERVWIMPEGTSIKVLKKRSLWLIPKIKGSSYNYSPRLQIWLWGKKRGV
jgi:organic radical activating enzyme